MSALLETSVSSASKARSRYFYQKRRSERVKTLPSHLGLLIQKLIKLAPASELGGIFRIILKKRNIRLSNQPLNFPGHQGVDETPLNSEGKQILDHIREVVSRLDVDEKVFTYQPKVGCGGEPAAVVEIRLQTLVFRLIWYLNHLKGFAQELAYTALRARIPALAEALDYYPDPARVPLVQLEDYTREYFTIMGKRSLRVPDDIRDLIPLAPVEDKEEEVLPLGPVLAKLADSIGFVGKLAENLHVCVRGWNELSLGPYESLVPYGSSRLTGDPTLATIVTLGPLCAQAIGCGELLFAMVKFSETLSVIRAGAPLGRQITSADLAGLYDVEHRISRTLRENTVWLNQIGSLVDVTTVRPMLERLSVSASRYDIVAPGRAIATKQPLLQGSDESNEKT